MIETGNIVKTNGKATKETLEDLSIGAVHAWGFLEGSEFKVLETECDVLNGEVVDDASCLILCTDQLDQDPVYFAFWITHDFLELVAS